jgi:very-short-patch-repair endonuclease
VIPLHVQDQGQLDSLFAACESNLEERVLDAMIERNLRLPDEAQKVIYDDEGVPIVRADFFYEPKLVIFVDGPPHQRDDVWDSDQRKRRQLKAKGFRPLIITEENWDQALDELERRLG